MTIIDRGSGHDTRLTVWVHVLVDLSQITDGSDGMIPVDPSSGSTTSTLVAEVLGASVLAYIMMGRGLGI